MIYTFRWCRVAVNDGEQMVRTLFADGTFVDAAPMLDEESIVRARQLGYQGSDEAAVWEMTRWHDLLHTVLAEARGEPWSPTLHAVAHGYALAPGVVEQEERLVLCVQRMLAAGVDVILAERR